MNASIVSVETLGISGTTAIVVNMGEILPSEPHQNVSLTAQYIMLEPPGFPARPPAGVAYDSIEVPGTYSNGSVITVFDFEAAGIVAAGGGIITGTVNP